MKSFLHRRSVLVTTLVLLILACLACSQEPKVNKETAEYHYAEAKKAMAEMKYEKAISLTSEILSQFAKSDYADRARILRMILMAGLSEGYRSMAEAYISGFEKSTKNAGTFRSNAFDYYRKQKSAALGVYEDSDYFQKNFSENTPYILDCDFPTRDVTVNRGLNDIASGKMIVPDLLKVTEETELTNKVILALTDFVGAGEDRAKARGQLATGPKTLDHAEFMLSLGRTLLDNQKLFGRMALNDPQTFNQFFQKCKEFSELTQKILKEKPNKEVQGRANRLKMEIIAIEKKPGRG